MRGAIRQAHRGKQIGNAPAVAPAGELHHHLDVLVRREGGNQIEELEHKADMQAAESAQFARSVSRNILPSNHDRAAVGRFDAADDVEQRRLARSARTEYRHELARTDIEIDLTQGTNRGPALAVGFAYPA